ncbi:MAG TPA: hypothetical protein PLW10_10790, partial [Myxococcota bacterium]|nr:hypothetical protein [Myxococcota bacterium]
MTAAESQPSPIVLRTLEARARALPLDSQMAECVDLLQSPELVVDDLLASLDQIRDAAARRERPTLLTAGEPEEGAFFYPARELFVQGAGCSFTCLATEVSFGVAGRGASADAGDTAAQTRRSEIDYAAVTCESRPFPVLGFAQREDAESAYPLLLRALTTLIELTRPLRFEVLDREVYRGLLGPAPVFDLALVLWDDDEEAELRRPLCELSR